MRTIFGFTLLELMTGIIVLIILSAVGIPSFINIIQNHRLAATAEQLFNFIQYARSEAIKLNTTVYVSFTAGSSWCYGANPGAACNCGASGGMTCTLGNFTAPNATSTTLSATGLVANSFSFDPIHAATDASNLLITFTTFNKTPAISVEVGVTGNSQLCSANVSGYQVCT